MSSMTLCAFLDSQIVHVAIAVAGQNGIWTVSQNKEAEAEFEALRQRQRTTAHEDFNSQSLTAGNILKILVSAGEIDWTVQSPPIQPPAHAMQLSTSS